MRSLFRTRSILFAALLAGMVAVLLPSDASAEPKPGRRPFRLFARPLGALSVNRVLCGLASVGNICVDSLGSSTVGGGFWPKGTINQYVFNSGLQAAGVIDPGDPSNPWAGDTTGAFLFDASGFINHGEQVQPIFNSNDPSDAAAWLDAARVPCAKPLPVPAPPQCLAPGDANGALYDPLLQGRIAASQGDVWWLTGEGNPQLNAARPHPLGILVEQRGLAWNFPSGNEDIIYFTYTFYNVTSLNLADYSTVRPSLQPLLLAEAQRFHQRNNAAFGVDLPDGGYTITDMFAAFSADMDVGEATVNYSTVVVPFALGNTYDHAFSQQPGWRFDPSIFSAPFFPGSGFVGVKYLKSPEVAPGVEAGLTLFSNTSRELAFDDASNASQLYRYLTGNLNQAAGDDACNTGNPQVTKICFINNGRPADMRFFQSSGPLNLGPGQFGTIVVAYIFAAPVAVGPCPGPACDVLPEDPTRLSNVSTASNANLVDSIMGYNGFVGDLDGDNAVDQEEIRTIPGSLLGKALVAQAVFDNNFLLPFAPENPEFFLIPGDNQVSVLWRPSLSDPSASGATPDPFFAVASQPTIGGAPNPLYDPNYRDFDLEGYRIWRGRVNDPGSLTLLAQFDYIGTTIKDFANQVNPDPGCAPELVPAINTTCPGTYTEGPPGTVRDPSLFTEDELVGPIIQVRFGERTALANGDAIVLVGDTALTGSGTVGGPFPTLANTGVPFVFVDNTARNSFRYFYVVTAFDINSVQSTGLLNASLESSRGNTKAVTPVAPATNYENNVVTTSGFFGRGVELNSNASAPTLDAATGKFSGPFPPANNQSLGFAAPFPAQIFAAPGSVRVRLDGIGMGDQRNGVPATYTFTAITSQGTETINIALDPTFVDGNVEAESPPFAAAFADPALAARFGATPGATVVPGQVTTAMTNYQQVVGQGRGCSEGGLVVPATGTTGCSYNGPRWFAGANETRDHPNAGMSTDFSGTVPVVPPAVAPDLNNAGELPGVATIFTPMTVGNLDASWRALDASLGGAARAGDIRVYWDTDGNSPGKIDSVIDVTHNVPVPFMRDSIGGGFGVLNVSGTNQAGSHDGRPTVLTLTDFQCVEPWKSGAAGTGARGQWGTCASATPFVLSDSAELNTIALFTGGLAGAQTAPALTNPGFILYVAGRISIFELSAPTLPSATVWTMRGYSGWVSGGQGAGGNLGPYAFTASERSFTALGAELQVNFDVVNRVRSPTEADLAQVHTVPDPYYVTNQFESSSDNKIIKFVNLPQDVIIRIYSSSGVLVRIIEHHSSTFGGEATWDVRNRNNQVVASGVYFYHLEAAGARRAGRFTVVNFAQ